MDPIRAPPLLKDFSAAKSKVSDDELFEFTVPAPCTQRYEGSFHCPMPRHLNRNRKRRAFASNGPNSQQDCLGTIEQDQERHPDPTLRSPMQRSPMRRLTPPSSPNVGFASPINRRISLLSPTTQELSTFGNMTIQSFGSSFASYSNGRMPVISDSYTPSDAGGTPRSQIKQSPRQSPRHVPLAIVCTNTPDTLSLPCTPRKSQNAEGNLPVFGSPRAIQTRSPAHVHESPKFLLPRCNRMTGKSGIFPGSIQGERDNPPMHFLRLDKNPPKNEGTSTRKSNPYGLPIASRSLLQKVSSADSLDDFNCMDDGSANGSLSDSCDEGGWFFLCSPEKPISTAEDDSTRSQKKLRSPSIDNPPSRKLDLSSAVSSSENSEVSNDNLLPLRVRSCIASGTQKSRKPITSTSTSSLFGMDIICENSMSRHPSTNMFSRDHQDAFGHPSAALARALSRTESDQSLGRLCLDSAQMYGGSRDMITPPIVMSSLPEQPPLMKRYLQQQKNFIDNFSARSSEKIKS
jgi:hypothetical protein